jgi:hypothetical protein
LSEDTYTNKKLIDVDEGEFRTILGALYLQSGVMHEPKLMRQIFTEEDLSEEERLNILMRTRNIIKKISNEPEEECHCQ